MKTVLHTIDTWGPGGAETVCVGLAGGLDPARFRSTAAVIREGWVHDAMLASAVETSIARPGDGSFDLRYLWRLAAVARRNRASVIQSHLLAANLYSALVARVLGIPSVATFHGMVDVDPGDRWAKVKLRLLTATVTRLVFVSDALRRHFRETHDVAERRTMVIPNGIDPDRFRPQPDRALRTELGLSDDVLLVGAIGNIRPAKGYDGLLHAAALVRDAQPQVRFVVVGEHGEPLFSRLLALRHTLGLDDHVIFLGYRDDVAAVLNGVDLFVSPSTSEGFSLTTIQAMACGLAVVATRSGGPEEIITDGDDGILVPVREPMALAAAIVALATDAPRRRTLGTRGRATVLRRFTLRHMIDAYQRVYEQALESS